MKLVLLIALVVSFRTSTGALTYLEKTKAYLELVSSSIDDTILSLTEETAEDLVDIIVTVKPSSVTLYYHNQSSIDNYIVTFTLANPSSLDSVFNASKDTFYTVHDFLNRNTSDINTLIKAAVLNRYDVNFIVVEWPAYSGYVYAYDSVPYVGNYLGEFINNVSATYNYSNANVKMAGHGLGAHICGIAGEVANGIGYIVGMNPAGPLYLYTDPSHRLSSGDANYVETIHIEAVAAGDILSCRHCIEDNIYRINFSVGHSDFWVKGTQPSCNVINNIACSHDAAYQYFAESVWSGGFDAIKCRIYTNDTSNTTDYLCDPLDTAYMGQYEVDKNATGDYFLTTNAAAPYAQGRKFNTTT